MADSKSSSGSRSRHLRRWLVHGVLGGCVAAGAALALRQTEPMRRAELQSYDLRMRNSRPAAPDTSIVIVAVDERSLQVLGPVLGQWPWPRFAYGRALDFLRFAGARQVVFDLELPEPDVNRPASDAELADAIAQAGNVVLPITLDVGVEADERRARAALGDTSAAYLPAFALAASTGAERLPEKPRVTVPLPMFGRQAAALGSINLLADPEDGATRRADLVYRHDGRTYPALALAAARLADSARFGGPVRVARDRVTMGRATVPLTDGRMLIRWHGPFLQDGRETYRVIPFWLLVNSYQQQSRGDRPDLDPESLRGKTVFVATTAGGLLDLRVTPFGTKEPGVMMHATMLDNLLAGDWLRRAPAWANVAFLAAVALLAGTAVTLFGSGLWEAVAAAAVLLAAMAFAHAAFRAGVWLDVVAPLTGGALAAVGGMVANYMTEGREKRRVREMFSRYVSPEYVRQLADEYRDLQLGGQRVPLTLLFSDIRGFTTISETYPAETVVEVLNEYLGSMAEVVFRHGGTLDKFIGDAVMAFWGAPVPVADHARRAADTALEMAAELERLNARWTAEGRPIRLDIGIGINTGEAIVGNIGSLGHKLDYTAIGDTVNLASRLEGLNKQYGTRVIVSEATRHALGEDYQTRELDDVRVKGKEQAVRIHELTGRRGASGVAPPMPAKAAATLALAAGLLLAGAGAAHAQKARWTDRIYQPGRVQAGRLVPLATTNASTDTLVLVAQVETYSLPPRWRAAIRRVEGGRMGDSLVLLAQGADVSVLTGVSTTPLREHRAAVDSIVRMVIARFDAQGRPKDTGAGRFVTRASDRHVVRVTERTPALNPAFPDALLAASRTRRAFGNLLRATAQQMGSTRSQETIATAGSRALTDSSRVATPEGVVTIHNDTLAVIAMEHRSVDPVALDQFIRQGRLSAAMPVKEEQVP
jgi:adenylate cyclase